MISTELNYNIYNKKLLAIVAIFQIWKNLHQRIHKNHSIYRSQKPDDLLYNERIKQK